MAPVRGWWRVQRLLGVQERPVAQPPQLSFGSWHMLKSHVLTVCHPEWRGVRTAAYSQGTPVVEVTDGRRWASTIAQHSASRGVETVVIQGFPPGSEALVEELRARSVRVLVVLHSSMAQHGAEPGEVAVADAVTALARKGSVARIGFVKAGMAEAFGALGFPTAWVPNRPPRLPPTAPVALGGGRHIGVFAEPFWRKNVVTQLAAVAVMGDATAHVLRRPNVGYLDGLRVVEHGLQPWNAFVALQASVDLNLYVTLSECDPFSPMESYLAGVPCLISRTSRLFADDADLWELTTVDGLDDPTAIAAAGMRLLEETEEAVARAARWLVEREKLAAELWASFVEAPA